MLSGEWPLCKASHEDIYMHVGSRHAAGNKERFGSIPSRILARVSYHASITPDDVAQTADSLP